MMRVLGLCQPSWDDPVHLLTNALYIFQKKGKEKSALAFIQFLSMLLHCILAIFSNFLFIEALTA